MYLIEFLALSPIEARGAFRQECADPLLAIWRTSHGRDSLSFILFPPGPLSLLALSDFRRARAGNEPARAAAQLPSQVRKAPSLCIEVRIEDAHLRNAIDRKVT